MKLPEIFQELEDRIVAENKEREGLGAPLLRFTNIKLYGQFALLAKEELASKLWLRATVDVDAVTTGDATVEQLLIQTVRKHGFEYDQLSSEIWIPPGATYELVYETNRFRVTALDTISILVSKAVKAPEKNRILIRDALQVFGDRLTNELKKHSVNIEFFEGQRTHGWQRR